MYSLLDVLLSLWTTGALPESTKPSFPFLFPPTPLLLCSSLPLWFAFKLLSLCCDRPPHICPHPPFPAHHESWGLLWQRCNCSLAIKALLMPCTSHTATLQMPAQMPAQSRTPFHLCFLKKFFVESPHKTLSWDRVHFNPFALLFFSFLTEGLESWNLWENSCSVERASHETPLQTWVTNEVIQETSSAQVFLRPYRLLVGSPKRLWTCLSKSNGFSCLKFANLNLLCHISFRFKCFKLGLL